MIDIHHHCIPGVDDGPRTLAEAVDLCNAARDDGIETIVATPHVLRGAWQNAVAAPLEQKLAELRDAIGGAPRLILGSEYYFAHDMTETLEQRSGIIPLAGSRYFLVEFDAHSVPPLVHEPFFRSQLAGWTPVIAHPERNEVFQAKSELLASLVRRGAKTQITAGSVLGDFGTAAQRAAMRWLREGLVHFVASDAHNVKRRPPRMRAAVEAIREIAGADVADALSLHNPAALLANHQLPWDPELPAEDEAGGFLTRLRKLIRP